MLNWMERIIRMRKEVPEIGWGDFAILRTGHAGVFALRYDWSNNSVVVVHNLSGVPREVRLDIGLEHPERLPLVNLFRTITASPTNAGKHAAFWNLTGIAGIASADSTIC